MIALAVLVLLTGLGFFVTHSVAKPDDGKKKTKMELKYIQKWREIADCNLVWIKAT